MHHAAASLRDGTAADSRQQVAAHDGEGRVSLEEQALGGLWRDRPRVQVVFRGGGGRCVLTVQPTSRWVVARPLVWVASPGFVVAMLNVRRRMRWMVESS